MAGAIFLGFLLGMRHALEADHLAAVASLVSGSKTLKDALRLGLAWGFGHTVTLCVIGIIVMSLDTLIPQQVALFLEFAVGLMLIWLGCDVFINLRKAKIHFHAHQHNDGTVHYHAHSHRTNVSHKPGIHEHFHFKRAPLRAFIVGLMHGMAGSAALLLLAFDQFENIWSGLLYIGLFGFGAMIGMMVLSFAIAIPLRTTLAKVSWAFKGIMAGLGFVSIGIGSWVIWHTVAIDGLFGV